ncbi:MAG: hypothetical protein AAGA56_25285, partial [Myxococcota bacterium]
SSDTEASAKENCAFQTDFFTERGKKGGVIVFFDRMKSQDKDARRVYGEIRSLSCTAMVGGTLLTRAMFSFFLGVARPKVPVKLFGDVEGALTWVRAVTAESN